MNRYRAAKARYISDSIQHYDIVAKKQTKRIAWGKRYYQNRLKKVYSFLVPQGKRVLEIGCGKGDLIAALKPEYGMGIDFSSEMIQQAQIRHPHLHFTTQYAHNLKIDEPYDYIILADLVNDLWDVHEVFEQVKRLSHAKTRIIINYYSRLWEPALNIARKLGIAGNTLPQNWLTETDINNFFVLAHLDKIRQWEEVLFPLHVPLLSAFANRILVKMWPFYYFSLTNFIMARIQPQQGIEENQASVSVIIPARNEAGHIPEIIERVPEMGKKTELIFVEGNSTDNTYQAIQNAIKNHPDSECSLLRQDGKGKGDAVRKAFQHAKGDILMILDADLSMPPEYLPLFFHTLSSGKGDFVNGVRLVYPMEEKAMRFFNFLGNKFFSLAFSWLLGQSLKDTLCGTKVLWRKDYLKIEANRDYFGDFDPFGDFDLIFGAVKQNLKIVDLPIRYRERTYGETNIQRWSHGWMLIKMMCYAAVKIKFQ